jgi:hypothetical protein
MVVAIVVDTVASWSGRAGRISRPSLRHEAPAAAVAISAAESTTARRPSGFRRAESWSGRLWGRHP